MNKTTQQRKASEFHALHHGEEMLVLPNAWDCASAKIYEAEGFPAVATTSSGISWSYGYADGENIPPELMLEVVERIAHSIEVPLTADIEAGYYSDEDKYAQFIKNLIAAGAVGINLEDSIASSGEMRPIEEQKERIYIAREASREAGLDLYINARIDAMLLSELSVEDRIAVCFNKAKAYASAGADGVFIPFIDSMQTVARLKKGIDVPLNILMSKSLDITALRRMQVNRVSVGGKPKLVALHAIQNIVRELRSGDEWADLYVDAPTYPILNGWFKR